MAAATFDSFMKKWKHVAFEMTCDDATDRELFADFRARVVTCEPNLEPAMLPIVAGADATAVAADGLVCALLLRVMRSTTKDDAFRLVRDATDGRVAWAALAESCGHTLLGKRGRRAIKEQVAALTWNNFPSGARYSAEAQRLSRIVGPGADVQADLQLAVVDGIAPHNGNGPPAFEYLHAALIDDGNATLAAALSRIRLFAREKSLDNKTASAHMLATAG